MFANNKLIHSIKDVKQYYIDNPDINVDSVSIYDSDVEYSSPVFMYSKGDVSLYRDYKFQNTESETKFNISHISIRRHSCFGKDDVVSYDIDIYVKFITSIDNKIDLPEFGKLMSLKDILEWRKSLPKDKYYRIRIDDMNHSTIIEEVYCFNNCYPDDIDTISNAIGQFTIEEIHVWTFQILICVNIRSRSKYLHDVHFY